MTRPHPVQQRSRLRIVDLPPASVVVARVAAVIVALVLASLAMDAIRLVVDNPIRGAGTLMALFDLDAERSVPTWFQTLLLAGTGALLLLWRDVLGAGRSGRWGWPLLGLTFLALSFDEMAALHERLIGPMRSLLDIDGGPLYFAWIIPVALLLVLWVALLVPFLWSLPRPTLVRFLAAGAVFVSGALGVEMMGGILSSTIGESSAVYNLATTLEEALEMAGALLFLRAVLLHWEASTGEATEAA